MWNNNKHGLVLWFLLFYYQPNWNPVNTLLSELWVEYKSKSTTDRFDESEKTYKLLLDTLITDILFSHFKNQITQKKPKVLSSITHSSNTSQSIQFTIFHYHFQLLFLQNEYSPTYITLEPHHAACRPFHLPRFSMNSSLKGFQIDAFICSIYHFQTCCRTDRIIVRCV